MKTFAAILMVLTGLVFPVQATAQTEKHYCDDGYGFVAGGEVDYRLAKVKGATNQRAYFYGDDGDCPEGTNCQKKSYLIAGDWIGEWVYQDNSIEIAKGEEGGDLAVTGTAIWKGVGDNFHIGDLDGISRPNGNLLKLGEEREDECKATLWLVGRFLIASDNLRCGGMNVTFSGVYLKK